MIEINPRLADMIRSFEDFRTEAYVCPGGAYTISAGVTRYLDGSPVKKGDRLSIEDAEKLFQATLQRFYEAVANLLPTNTAKHVTEACVSLAWNIGVKAFEGSTCRKRLAAGDAVGAAEALRWWNKATDPRTREKRVLGGLVARREAEADLLLNGWDGTSGPAVVIIEEAPPQAFKSKTILGALLAIASAVLPMLMTAVPTIVDQAGRTRAAFGTESGTQEIITAIGVVLGAGFAIWSKFYDWRHGRAIQR